MNERSVKVERMAEGYRKDSADIQALMRVWRCEHFAYYSALDDPSSLKHAQISYRHLWALRLAQLPKREGKS